MGTPDDDYGVNVCLCTTQSGKFVVDSDVSGDKLMAESDSDDCNEANNEIVDSHYSEGGSSRQEPEAHEKNFEQLQNVHSSKTIAS